MKKFKVALQLYSIRDDMEEDMDGALKKVKEIGYDYVEFAGYYGHSAQEVRNMLDKYDLECISVHQAPSLIVEDCKTQIEFLKTIGVKYCAIPGCSVEKLKGSDAWEKTINYFTVVGKALKENGIQFMYHNHDYEFNKFEDKFILDWIFETVPSDLLQPQLDTCWVRYAGYDPAEYLLKYSGRISVLHLKDFVCKNLLSVPVYTLIGNDGKGERKATKEENGFEYRPVGYGIQDFPKILKAAEKAGVEIVVVEQDSSTDRTPLESAKMSRDYLKTMGI